MINVYTDGSCINNGLPDAISGYGVYFSENDLRNESKKIEGKKHTNNIAELTGFIRALEILNEEIIKGTHINVYTDSEYVIKCASNYGEKLERNNWKTSNNKDPPNVELVKKAHNLFKNLFNVRLIHINSHTNKQDIHSIGNEMADKLANEAIGINSCPYNDKKKFINISFGNKDMAKELGAKWDKNKKSWYYDDKISEENINKLKDLESNNSNCIRTDVSNDKKNYIKISFAKKNLAKSYGAKWDPITKSWYYLDNLDSEKITKLKELQN
jgi:ribonuclease HI|uniref:ribonuclease H n=1 Tax=viral metagenome TaxID=1070528 RepID=A0A6C0JV22_9ZZZZ